MKQAPNKPIKDLDVPERVRRLALMRAFHFDLEDLDANHHNYLSKRQRSRLYNGPWDNFIIWSVFLGILFDLIYLKWAGDNSAQQPHIVVIIFLVSVVGGFLISKFAKRVPTELRADLQKGEIAFVQGKFSQVFKYEVPATLFRQPISFYAPQIGKIEFPIQTNTEGFVEGQIYRVYYLPHSKIILSVEWIAPEELEQTP